MKTKTTLLAALLFAGASQAAMAQDRDHGDRGERPAAQGHWGDRPAPAHDQSGAPRGVPQAAPQVGPTPGGHWRYGVQPSPQPGAVAPAPGVGERVTSGGDRHFDGARHNFAPGGTADCDRRWDRRDAPREVPLPGPNAERGWDRDHDGHAADARHLDHDRRGDGRWDRDRRGPPPNWQHWERGRFPPVYASSHRYRVDPYRRPYGFFVRSWAFGDFLPRGWYGPGYWIDDFYDYDLPWPPPGYHWVRVGPDVLLVDDYTGRIVQVVRDLFW
jgi:Ni/Co efflux regulator RcnB